MKKLKFIGYTLLVILLSFYVLGALNIGNVTKPKTFKGSFISIDGERIRYFQKGSGKDILLIHGTPGSIEDWNYLIDSLAIDHRVTAFDREGQGFSSANIYQYHIKENAVLIKRLIDTLALKSPLLIGHSYGGSSLANFATQSKDTLIKYVFIDPPLYYYHTRFTSKLMATPLIGKGICTLAKYTIAEKQITEKLNDIFENQTENQLKELIKERSSIWLQTNVLYANSKELANYQDDLNSVKELYKSIHSPVTIITCEDANKSYKNDCIKFHEEVKNSKLFIIKNSGHYIQIDQSQKVLEIVRLRFKI